MNKLFKILTSSAAIAVLFFSVDITAQAQDRGMPDRRGEPIYTSPNSSPTISDMTARDISAPSETEPPGPPLPPGAPVQTPIDGGLGLLLAAGGIYAVRRMRKQKLEE